MAENLRVVAIPGSLRDGSYNRALLEAAQNRARQGMTVEIVDIDDVPVYDADVEARGDPEPVTRLKEKVESADALLIATPEYQHGVPGVLKNALDWASRPPGDAPIMGKPVAIMGATVGSFGTARAQEQLRTTLIYNDCPMVTSPEVLVSDVQDKVDDDGQVTDEETLERIARLLDSLTELASESLDEIG